MNILFITKDFRIACGRSYYAYLLLKYLKKIGHNVYLLTNGGNAFERINTLGIKYFIIKSLHSNIVYSIAKNSPRLLEIIKTNKIEIIHTLHRKSEFIAIQTLKKNKINKIKTVFTSLSLVKRKYFIEFKSDKIIAISNCIYDMLKIKFNVPEKKIVRIPVFVENSEKSEEYLSGDKDNTKIILFVGRFHKEKNLDVLLYAVSMIKDFKIKIVLIGDGNEISNYKKIINKHKLIVEFVAPLYNLKKYFENADICVLPSSIDPFPTFMLQAGLYCRPFIGSDVDGISEMIKNKYNGLLFENNDANDLKEKIELFLSDNVLSKKCAANLHNDVMLNHLADEHIIKIDLLYKNLLTL
jgi:glycosyltransferase involved in cell wall biosynthesis